MYEKTELDTQMEAFIADAEKEFTPEPEAAPAEVTTAPDTAQENTAAAEKVSTDPAERGLERLVSREMELREREARLSGTEKEMEAMRTRLRELESRQISEDLLTQIKLSPSQGLRTLGLDPDEIVRQALVEKLGDRADVPEVKEMMERNRLRREMEALKAQVREQEMARAAQEYFGRIASGANEFVRNPSGLEKHAPTVATVAKSNPERVYEEIMEEITRDAQVRASREPNGEPIPYEEAAKRVEKRWSVLKQLLVPVVPGENPGKASMSSPKTPVEAQKTPPNTIKPPEKPLAPWLQKKVDEEEALRLAIAEYHKANQR